MAISKLYPTGKLEKNDPSVVYMGYDEGPFRCDNCEYWSNPSKCTKVNGNIEPGGCCNLYEKK